MPNFVEGFVCLVNVEILVSILLPNATYLPDLLEQLGGCYTERLSRLLENPMEELCQAEASIVTSGEDILLYGVCL